MSQPAPYAKYIDDGDIVYVRLRDVPIVKTKELDPWRNVDYAADDSVVAIEFVNASGGIDLAEVPERGRVLALLRTLKVTGGAPEQLAQAMQKLVQI